MIVLYFSVKNKKEFIKVEKADNLLFVLDKFVKKNIIDKTDIKPYKIEFSDDIGFTSQRIAQVIFKGLKYGLSK